jgi:hypothetical protein
LSEKVVESKSLLSMVGSLTNENKVVLDNLFLSLKINLVSMVYFLLLEINLFLMGFLLPKIKTPSKVM